MSYLVKKEEERITLWALILVVLVPPLVVLVGALLVRLYHRRTAVGRSILGEEGSRQVSGQQAASHEAASRLQATRREHGATTIEIPLSSGSEVADRPATLGQALRQERQPESAAALPTTPEQAGADEPAASQHPDAVEPSGEEQVDDLTVIEGIGPRIAELFSNAGITTFSQLAETGVDRLSEILAEAKIRRIANPESWPEQAALAAEGKFDELTRLQESLKGGRRVE